MTMREIVDRDLLCDACGAGFVFSTGEQELYRLRGIDVAPRHCPDCARGRILSGLRRSRADRATA